MQTEITSMQYTNTFVPEVAVDIRTMQNTKAEFLKLLREKKKNLEYLRVCFNAWEKSLLLYGTAHIHQYMTSVLKYGNLNHISIAPTCTAKNQLVISPLSLVLMVAMFTPYLITKAPVSLTVSKTN